MNNRFISIMPLIASSAFLVSGCGDTSSYETPNTSGEITNSGTISQKNFSLLTADIYPAVIDGTTGDFTKTDVELTVFIGDRNNQALTDAHTVYFEPEYGLVNPPSCVTAEGFCSVTWSAIKRPEVNGPGSDGFVTITAYSTGEEGFTDTNGNGVYDDDDDVGVAAFDDLEEPYVDVDESNGYTAGDKIIDVVSSKDLTGANGIHDDPDRVFNGLGCTHSSLCGTATSIAIFDMVTMSIVNNATYTIGGTVTGIPATESLVIQNNSGDDLTITANGDFEFSTALADGDTYIVEVLTPPPGAPTCIVSNETGTVSGANVENVTISCS
jgi:hypothetical protein